MVEYYKEKLNVAIMTLMLIENGAYNKCVEIANKLALACTKEDIVEARDALQAITDAMTDAEDEVADIENRLEEAISKRDRKA